MSVWGRSIDHLLVIHMLSRNLHFIAVLRMGLSAEILIATELVENCFHKNICFFLYHVLSKVIDIT